MDFKKGSTFSCVNCTSKGAKPYDTEERTWRHLNFFEHKIYLTARVPRVSCGHCGKTRANDVLAQGTPLIELNTPSAVINKLIQEFV